MLKAPRPVSGERTLGASVPKFFKASRRGRFRHVTAGRHYLVLMRESYLIYLGGTAEASSLSSLKPDRLLGRRLLF